MVIGAIVFLLSCGWVLNCIKNLPRDIAELRMRKEDSHKNYKEDLIFFSVSWTISVVLFIFVIFPVLTLYASIPINFIKLLLGFSI